ncbi:hypothetical protein P691DRAFT_813102 [Macrolepiota fuliginosa MF-IS2]|uniref:RING-type domain-containing protein n=1 Tax=Macrolepiota fuliginosa MF-IS2 TaxID=1400762 RepID=A0A9P5XQ89_9AGAR|nr:hypothetical protein P691DRAFT_813102 [Macrolepiota fuliginosa MF-IS2]
MSELLCTICHQTDSYRRFLIQHCGHVFCEDCISQISTRERRCATCRRDWGSHSPFRIYLNFPDPDKSSRVLHHIESIDQDTPAIFADKAGDIIKGLVNGPNKPIDDDTATALLQAVHRLEERVAPLMSDLEHAREDNEVLRQELKTVNSQLKSKEALTIEIDRLNRTVMEREVAITSMRDELVHEKQKRNSENETNRRLTRSLRKKQEEIGSKEKEIEGLRAEIQERDKQLSLMKTKLRALAKLTKTPKSPAQNLDGSLVVEQPLAGIENAGLLKRIHKSGMASSSKPLATMAATLKRKKTDT